MLSVVFALLLLIFFSLTKISQFDYHVSQCVHPRIFPSWTWLTVSFPMLGKFSVIIPSNIFSGPYSLSSSGPL